MSTLDLGMFDRTISNVVTACCTDLGCDSSTPEPPTPSPQALSLQWLLDNMDRMIEELESCCCQDKIIPTSNSSAITADFTTAESVSSDVATADSITAVDNTETGVWFNC